MFILVTCQILHNTIFFFNFQQINGVNVFAFSTIGYLMYSFAQIFMFCIHGNELIEEVSIHLRMDSVIL